MAANLRPLPDLRELLSTEGSVNSKLSSLPKLGAGNSGVRRSSKWAVVSGAISSKEDCSAKCLAVSLSISSWAGEGTAALRASGSSHEGIFNSSSSSIEETGGETIFAGSARFTGTGAGSVLAAICKNSAKGSYGLTPATTGAGGGGGAEARFSAAFSADSKLESCSCKRAVCCLSSSVCGPAAARGASGSGGGGSTKLGSGSSDKLLTSTIGGAAEACAEGAKMEACASGVRGKSNVEEMGPAGLRGTASTWSSAMSEAGVAGTSEAGASGFGAAGISITDASGATILDSENFGSRSLATTAGTAGTDSKILGAPFAGGGTRTGATVRGATGAAPATGEPTAGEGVREDCEGAPMRSPGKRMPQKPTTDSVNSSST